MPYKSQAQRRKFHAMAARGEIDPRIVREHDVATRGMMLPERVKKMKKRNYNYTSSEYYHSGHIDGYSATMDPFTAVKFPTHLKGRQLISYRLGFDAGCDDAMRSIGKRHKTKKSKTKRSR